MSTTNTGPLAGACDGGGCGPDTGKTPLTVCARSGYNGDIANGHRGRGKVECGMIFDEVVNGRRISEG